MNNVFDQALEVNGIDYQMNQATEEMAELIQKLNHYRRKMCEKPIVCEEIADVVVSLGSLKRYFGEEEVERQIGLKTDRLQNRLDEEYGN